MNSEIETAKEGEIRTQKEGERPVCPNPDCPDKTVNDVIIHSRQDGRTRFCCKVCGRTFTIESEQSKGQNKPQTPPNAQVRYALWLSNQGYSHNEIAFIVGVTRRTVVRWLRKHKVK